MTNCLEPSQLSQLQKELIEEAKRRGLRLPTEDGMGCLWPAPFNQPSAETAYKFLLSLRTWNEAASEVQPMPDRDYLREYAREWWEAFQQGKPLCTEKCRRMVISWAARGLELYVMGLGRCDCILVGEDLEAAAKHVWRLEFLYEDLKKRNPNWGLPPHSKLRYEGDRKLKMFGLANGSTCNYANGQSSGLQGDGTAIITMEEAAIYRYLAAMLAQAKIITQGAAGARKGFINMITNAAVEEEWQKIKRGGEDETVDIELEELIRGLEACDLATGMRYLKLHHYADPDKDAEWLQQVEQEMADTPRDFRLQILMEDMEDFDALWQRHDIDAHKIDLAHAPEFLKIIVSIDPASKGDHVGADETGILVTGGYKVGDDLHACVIADLSGNHSPEKTARLVVMAEQKFGAAEIAYESNQGGDWIPALINTEYERQEIKRHAPFIDVHVHQGKVLRAEPEAARYRQGKVHHIRSKSHSLAKLESQMCKWNPLDGKLSPGRLDALVIGLNRIFGGGVGQSSKSSAYNPRGRAKGRASLS
jgi:hypothetical protein